MNRPFGHDRVETSPEGDAILIAPVSKGWLPRQPRSYTAAEHPGSAVRWEGEIFEVLEAVPLPAGGVRYKLAPWDGRHAMRVIQPYDAASEAGLSHQQEERRTGVRRRRISILLSPLLGHLPGPVQERMEWDFGAPARVATIVSALPLFVLGVLGFLAARIAALGGGSSFLPWLAARPGLSFYLLVESGVRLYVAFLLGNPMGSLPGFLAYELWSRWRGHPPAPALSTKGATAGVEQSLADRYHMLEPLLALLSTGEQETLEVRFGFDSIRWGRRTAAVLLLISGLNVFVSVGIFLGGTDTFSDFLWFLVGGYFIAEQLLRRREFERGRPSGSALGVLVRPLAKKLLLSDSKAR